MVFHFAEENNTEASSGILDSLSRQRIKIHMKLLGQLGQQTSQPVIKEDKPTYREQFVPPRMSMVSLFMCKVSMISIDWIEKASNLASNF